MCDIAFDPPVYPARRLRALSTAFLGKFVLEYIIRRKGICMSSHDLNFMNIMNFRNSGLSLQWRYLILNSRGWEVSLLRVFGAHTIPVYIA